jgi:hypothetical protein
MSAAKQEALDAAAQRQHDNDRRGGDLQAWLNAYTLDRAQTAYAEERRPPKAEPKETNQ